LEAAADRDMVAITADPEACIEALAALGSLLGAPDRWTLLRRLLYASHPAMQERLDEVRSAAPVTAIYVRGGQPWLYVWGVYGKLADPAGALSAFWNRSAGLSGLLSQELGGGQPIVDTEPGGPLGGNLQCDWVTWTCAWADDSGIVVVSYQAPADASSA